VKGVVILVEDTGPGISPAERDHVFQRFYRAERARQTPGNGLGLGLVAAIAKLHGFTVEVRDSPDGGARFAVLCPLGEARGQEGPRDAGAVGKTAVRVIGEHAR